MQQHHFDYFESVHVWSSMCSSVIEVYFIRILYGRSQTQMATWMGSHTKEWSWLELVTVRARALSDFCHLVKGQNVDWGLHIIWFFKRSTNKNILLQSAIIYALVIILILKQYMCQSTCVCITSQIHGPLGWDFWPSYLGQLYDAKAFKSRYSQRGQCHWHRTSYSFFYPQRIY